MVRAVAPRRTRTFARFESRLKGADAGRGGEPWRRH